MRHRSGPRFAALATASLLALGATAAAQAGVVFYVADPTGFAAGRQALSPVYAGTENFESSTLAANTIQQFNDPLTPGVANGAFPAGTATAPGVTVQSNTLGGNPTAPAAHGSNGLSTASAGYSGTPTDQVSNNWQADSFDVILAPPLGSALAVGLTPLYFDSAAATPTSNAGSLTVRVYNGNTLLGTQVISGINYSQSQPSQFLGMVATDGDVITRINLWDGNVSSHWQGADDIAVYAKPADRIFASGFQ